MITCKLAKKLKDAGFPQKASFYSDEMFEDDPYTKIRPASAFKLDNYGIPIGIDSQLYAIPTLSELIKECGMITLSGESNDWFAYNSDNPDSGYEISTNGSTPEEAVALLWLELNKKQYMEARLKIENIELACAIDKETLERLGEEEFKNLVKRELAVSFIKEFGDKIEFKLLDSNT